MPYSKDLADLLKEDNNTSVHMWIQEDIEKEETLQTLLSVLKLNLYTILTV